MGSEAVVNGTRLSYCRKGDGPRRILCLPGALGSWRTDFAPQLAGLAGDRWTVVGWDPPGYGGSRDSPRRFDEGFLARDADLAHSLMHHLDLLPYSVLGWSDGGITALLLAHRQRQTRQATERLVVWGANAYVTEADVAIYESIRDTARWSERMRRPFVELYGAEYFQETWSAWVDAFKRFQQGEGGNICREMLPEIANETLIVHGAKDPVVPVEHPNFLHKHLANSRLVIHDEGKHNLHLRYSEWFNDLVVEFLSK